MNGAEFLDHVDSTLGRVRMRVNGGPGRLLKVTGRRSEVYAPILRLIDAPPHTVRQIDVTAHRDGSAEFTLEARPVNSPPANVREAHFARTVPRPVPAVDLLDHLAKWTVR